MPALTFAAYVQSAYGSTFFGGNKVQKRLVMALPNFDIDSLQDHLMVVAYNIESSLLQCGAKSGDYTLLDLYKMAKPFTLAKFSSEDSLKLMPVAP